MTRVYCSGSFRNRIIMDGHRQSYNGTGLLLWHCKCCFSTPIMISWEQAFILAPRMEGSGTAMSRGAAPLDKAANQESSDVA